MNINSFANDRNTSLGNLKSLNCNTSRLPVGDIWINEYNLILHSFFSFDKNLVSDMLKPHWLIIILTLHVLLNFTNLIKALSSKEFI